MHMPMSVTDTARKNIKRFAHEGGGVVSLDGERLFTVTSKGIVVIGDKRRAEAALNTLRRYVFQGWGVLTQGEVAFVNGWL